MSKNIDRYLAEKGDAPELNQARAQAPEDGQTRRQYVPEVFSMRELMQQEFEPLRMPVDGLIVEGLTVLAGAAKLGKSWFALSLCCAVASGKPFLGRSVQRGEVLYLALEDSKRRLKSRFEKLGERPTDALRITLKSRDLTSGLLDDLEASAAKTPDLRLVIIDTLQKVRGVTPQRVNAYGADYSDLGALKRFADRHHIALIVVHHLNKLRDVSDPLDRISGSTAITGAADTIILLDRERGSDDAVLRVTGRDVWSDDIPLRMCEGRWTAISPEAAERERYERDPIVRVVRELLGKSFGGELVLPLATLRDAVIERTGAVISTRNELRHRLSELSAPFKRFDNIYVTMDKRTGTKRGVAFQRGGTVTPITQQQ